MSEAPERIWGLFDQHGHGSTMLREISQAQSPLFHGPKPTEYIRADLAEAKLDKALSIALYECPYSYGTGSYKNWWHDRRVLIEKLRGE